MTLLDPAWLIHIATAILLIGYFIRDELKLRVMIIVSSVVYNLYYWLHPDPPLWDSVMTGFLLIAVNIYVLIQVLLDRTTFRLNVEQKRLFGAFKTLTPGQFRRLLKIAEWKVGDGEVLTRQGEPTTALYYIFDGAIAVEKGENKFRLPEGNFVGEVAYVLGGGATATTVAEHGTRYVQWDREALKQVESKHPAIANALNALLTRDLAKKLTESFRPDDALPA